MRKQDTPKTYSSTSFNRSCLRIVLARQIVSSLGPIKNIPHDIAEGYLENKESGKYNQYYKVKKDIFKR